MDCPLLDCDLLIGLCLGSLLDYSHEETKAQCFKLCQNSPNCHWYSYNSKDKTCLQFNDCPTINEKFEDYFSSSTKVQLNQLRSVSLRKRHYFEISRTFFALLGLPFSPPGSYCSTASTEKSAGKFKILSFS